MKKKEWLLILLVIPITLLINLSEVIELVFDIPRTQSFYQTYASMMFSRSWSEMEDINTINSMFNVVMSIICNFMFGIYIYKDLCVSGTYYFVRQRNRKKWFLLKMCKVAILIFLYTLIQVVVTGVLAVGVTNQKVDKFVVTFISFAFATFFIYNLLTTLLINILALRMGSVLSFVLVYILMALSFGMAYYCMLLGMPEYPVNYFLPTEITEINMEVDISKPIELYKANKNMFVSLGINSAYVVLLIISGLFVVNYSEISLTDKENLLG